MFLRPAACRLGLILAGSLLWAAGGDPARAQEGSSGFTYYKDILPIWQKYCIHCHHTGGLAPQSLETYKLARSWIRTSRKMMQEGTMPPWHGGEDHARWKNAVMPTLEEIEIVHKWVEDEAPEGDEADAPTPMDFSNVWLWGEPDRTLALAEPFKVPAEGAEIYRAFVLGEELTEELWLEGVQLAPSEPDVVFHMMLSAAPAAVARKADEADPAPGFVAFDGGWGEGTKDFLAFWNKGMTVYEKFPDGSGVLIPKGYIFVLQIHYMTVGEEVSDQARVGLYLAKTPPARELKAISIENRKIRLPADTYDEEIKAEARFEKPITLYQLLPRMHYLGREMEIAAEIPGEGNRKLLHVRDYDYKLQAAYTPVEPIALPAGTRILVTAYYENSSDNPNNPNMALKDAAYGPGPQHEIMSLVLQYTEE